MEPSKYLLNEKNDIYENLQVSAMEQNASDVHFFDNNLLPV